MGVPLVPLSELPKDIELVCCSMPSPKALIELLGENVLKSPDSVWLKDLNASGSNDWTWREAQKEISAIASWLNQTLGEPGQSVSVLSRNRAHWVMADMAILASANISVPMFTTQSSTIAEYIFDFTDVKVLFVGEAENWEKIRNVIPDGVVIVTFPGVEVEGPSLRWDDLLHEYAGQTVSFDGRLDDMVSIVFTSGTTGMPKGVMQTNVSMTVPLIRSIPALGLVENPRLVPRQRP
ncbi:MAG: AMP-binding protein [Pseudomonadota bacterium]